MPSSKRHYPYYNNQASNPEFINSDFFKFWQSTKGNFHANAYENLTEYPTELAIAGAARRYLLRQRTPQEMEEAVSDVMNCATNLFDWYKNKDRFIARISQICHSTV